MKTSTNNEMGFVFGHLSYHVPREGVKSAFDFCLKTDKVKRVSSFVVAANDS